MTNDRAPIDSDNEVKPWFNWKLKIGVSQDLEAIGPLFRLALGYVAVQTGHEPIERVEHIDYRALSPSP